ncbi:HAD domain-containing protein [Pseudomonas aeruginosa]|uniref:HAD domain-containing protein n=2 Tax=Pseudomonas aeruginosa TaxID=287 RepID=UPI0020C9466F|nr:HAD domain-containing protein [Pseudomonas aeruginosa]
MAFIANEWQRFPCSTSRCLIKISPETVHLNMKRLLFLDYDGVLHPDAVYLSRRGIELRASGSLFMWAPQLIEALADHQDLRIVLSTSWARNLGFSRARQALPKALRHQVSGATWHSAMGRGWPDYIPWDVQTRWEQIAAYLSRLHEPVRWLAIDDDARGWASADRDQLIQTDPNAGLSDTAVMSELIQKLQATREIAS